ncbi:MAG: hypothetical protein IH875_11185 [Candidatus Dadabacteria bacterium]|nr:hypothetical protein [Candidatus Dadabacteria bacterium]
MLSEHIQDISVFNLKTFRDIIQKWEQDKEIGKIILILQKLLSHYGNYKKDSKERNKMIQYLKITRLINNGTRRMVAYKIVSPGEKENTVEQRYLRQKYQLQKSGYEVDSPDHISVLMKDWDISEFELGF